jgi:hypothetical protein
LKPYVAHITPRISEDDRVDRRITIDDELLKDIETKAKNAPKGSLVAAGQDPLSQLSRK